LVVFSVEQYAFDDYGQIETEFLLSHVGKNILPMDPVIQISTAGV